MDKKFWSRTEIGQLIARYKENPVLWDTSSQDYRNIVKKRKAQKKLAAEFNTTIVELGRKIRILRAQWLKEFKRMKEPGDEFGADNVYISNWIWFQPLQFICNESKNLEEFIPENSSENWTLEQIEPINNEIDNHDHDYIYLYVKESNDSDDNRHETFEHNEQSFIEDSLEDTNIDEYKVFGNYVANKLRSLRIEKNVQELKNLIIQNIEQCTHKDNREYFSM